MRLRVEHRTEFGYDAPISEAYTEVRLRPVTGGGQQCLSFRLVTEPHGPTVLHYLDRFDNDVRHFSVLEPHDRLAVVAVSDVITAAHYADAGSVLTSLEEHDYVASTAYAPASALVADLVAPVRQSRDPFALMAAVNEALAYEAGATHVHTSADEAHELGRGVCQDFTHVMIAACRTQGLPARYVSGYLYDPTLPVEAASHAWVDVFVEGRGWIALDPTHNREQDEHYVRVAVGRDYGDVPPSRGVYRGNAEERLSVSVRLTAV